MNDFSLGIVVISALVLGATLGIGGFSNALLSDAESHGTLQVANGPNQLSAGGWCEGDLEYDPERKACKNEDGLIVIDIVDTSPSPLRASDAGGTFVVDAVIPNSDEVDTTEFQLDVGDNGGRIDATNAVCENMGSEYWSCSIQFESDQVLSQTESGPETVALYGEWITGYPFVGTEEIKVVKPGPKSMGNSG